MLRARQSQAVFLGPSALSLRCRELLQVRTQSLLMSAVASGLKTNASVSFQTPAPPARFGHGLRVVCGSGQHVFRRSSGSDGPRNAPKQSGSVGSSSGSTVDSKPPKPWWSSWWVALIVTGVVMCLFHFNPPLISMLIRESTKGALALATAVSFTIFYPLLLKCVFFLTGTSLVLLPCFL